MTLAHLASYLLGSSLPIISLAKSVKIEKASRFIRLAASKAFRQLTSIEPTERREFIWG
jgi:hypothetical protein